MRRSYAVIALCLCAALLGAGRPPRPTPTPAPTASPTPVATPHLIRVVVFPFGTSSDLKAGTGLQSARLFAQQMGAAGGIDALTGSDKVARTQYRSEAQRLNADYYVSGYMTLLGDGVSLVEQVVSTQSGTIVFGRTAQVQSVEDAAAQARGIHDLIVDRENAYAEALAQQSSSASASPTPLPNNQANLGGLGNDLRGIFKHGNRVGPTPRPTAIPDAAKPSRAVLVARVSGLSTSDDDAATQSLLTQMNLRFRTQAVTASGDLAPQADRLCGTNRNNTIAGGTLSAVSQRRGISSRASYTFTLHVYTCFGAQLAQASGTGATIADAVSSAVAAYAADHPRNS